MVIENLMEKDTLNLIQDLNSSKYLDTILRVFTNDDIMIESMKKNAALNLQKMKEEFVLANHINEDGTPKVINAPQMDKAKALRMWNTLVGKKRITSTTKEGLINKLFLLYGGNELVISTKIKDIYKLALENYVRTKDIKEKTVIEMEKNYKRFINKEFEEMDILAIDEEWLKNYTLEFLEKEKKKGTLFKKKAFFAYKGVLNLIFDFAVDKKVIEKNISQNLKVETFSKYIDCNLKKRTREDVMHTEHEYVLILEEAKKHASMPQFKGYYNFDKMMILHDKCGVRPGELCVLKWKYIDFDKMLIRVCEQQEFTPNNKSLGINQNYDVNPYTKNEKGNSKGGRLVAIDDEIKEMLFFIKEMQKKHDVKTPFVFANLDGTPVKEVAYATSLRKICKKLGMESHGTYTFRRHANCRNAHNGMDVIDRGKYLGNSSLVNEEFYTFESEDYLDKARRIMSKKM